MGLLDRSTSLGLFAISSHSRALQGHINQGGTREGEVQVKMGARSDKSKNRKSAFIVGIECKMFAFRILPPSICGAVVCGVP